MRKPKPPVGTADDTEHAFYDALQQGDLERLMACWAEDEDIVCVHPGGPRLLGHASVRTSFEALFTNGSLKVHGTHVRRMDAGGCAVHSVLERVDMVSDDGPQSAWVVATNVYAKTARGWRMVVHHASPGSAGEPEELFASAHLLH